MRHSLSQADFHAAVNTVVWDLFHNSDGFYAAAQRMYEQGRIVVGDNLPDPTIDLTRYY